MALSQATVKKQIARLKPIVESCSIETTRKWQDRIGEIMALTYRKRVTVLKERLENFDGAWIIPKDETRSGVILYLHGGGFVAGGIDYAKGFGAKLAMETGTRVFCIGYRLAPENMFPCALQDAEDAYRYLLTKGYSPKKITVIGESAGGNLCLSLCKRLPEEEQPAGVIVISPWTDLTLSGESLEYNKEKDPSLSRAMLEFYSEKYTSNPKAPFVSPLFHNFDKMPPVLIFAGGDEILLSDSERLHKKLIASGVNSRLVVSSGMWHAYLLYDLKENKKDIKTLNQFLSRTMAKENKLRWMRLDNAAKIYPAARNQHWSNLFRVSATLKEEVDVNVLRSALDVTLRRFPSIGARLRKGMFWYYLEQLSSPPDIKSESSYPLTRMDKKETRECALRVIAYKKRIAVEIFHSLTDGNGAMVFLKTLVAEYLTERYNVNIPCVSGVLDRLQEPDEAEFEDGFIKNKGDVKMSRNEATAWRLGGTMEPGGFLNLTCFKIPVDKVLENAHKYNVSLTAYLTAVLMMAIQKIQKDRVPVRARRKPIKVLIPVNLRKLFKSKTLRNFVFYTTPEIEPRLGEYDFEEILNVVTSKMSAEITKKQMSKRIAANVESEQLFIVKLMPLFIKNLVMKAIFNAVGEKKSCLSLSNLGAIKVPEEMEGYIERFDFILGVQATAPYNCGVLSFKDTLYVNFIRNIKESYLEATFFEVLRDMGIPVTVESNRIND